MEPELGDRACAGGCESALFANAEAAEAIPLAAFRTSTFTVPGAEFEEDPNLAASSGRDWKYLDRSIQRIT